MRSIFQIPWPQQSEKKLVCNRYKSLHPVLCIEEMTATFKASGNIPGSTDLLKTNVRDGANTSRVF